MLVVQYRARKKGISRYPHTLPASDKLHISVQSSKFPALCLASHEFQNPFELPFQDKKSFDHCKELQVVGRNQVHKRAAPASAFEAHLKAIQRGHDDSGVGGLRRKRNMKSLFKLVPSHIHY
jgi:hypothetical protein